MSNITIDASGKLMIEDAMILYRNFSGAQTDFNAPGKRNFNVIIDDAATAQKMLDDGWNVKMRAPRDPQEDVLHHVKVNVNFSSARPPRIFMHTGSNVVELTEQTVGQLDQADIIGCDMLISPYAWERNGGKGISAYLDTMHVVIKEDPFAHKYANLEG